MSKKRKIFSTILIILIIATVCFIWSNSFLGKEDSSKTSEGVYASCVNFVSNVFGGDFSGSLFSVITHAVFRKLAHFFEFFVLGLEASLLYICLGINKKDKLMNIIFLIFGLIIASIDELIQLFTERGSQFKDVLLDYSGYLFALLLIMFISFLRNRTKRKV